jgi:hypothetical protein
MKMISQKVRREKNTEQKIKYPSQTKKEIHVLGREKE